MKNDVITNQETIQMTPTETQLPVQQSPSKIEIGTLEAVIGIAVILVGIGVAWGSLRNSVSNISKMLHDSVVPDLKDVRERFLVVEDHVETLWKDKIAPAHSPRQLNDKGETILKNSGIKDIVESKKDELLAVLKKKNIDNAYDAEKAIEEVMMELPKHCPDIVKELKEGAFKVGHDIPVVLFVGSIHLRNLIFKDLGFELDDLDKNQPPLA